MLSTIRNRPDEVRRVLRAMQLAKQEVLRSKEKTTAMILKYLQVDKEAAEETYAALKGPSAAAECRRVKAWT